MRGPNRIGRLASVRGGGLSDIMLAPLAQKAGGNAGAYLAMARGAEITSKES